MQTYRLGLVQSNLSLMSGTSLPRPRRTRLQLQSFHERGIASMSLPLLLHVPRAPPILSTEHSSCQAHKLPALVTTRRLTLSLPSTTSRAAGSAALTTCGSSSSSFLRHSLHIIHFIRRHDNTTASSYWTLLKSRSTSLGFHHSLQGWLHLMQVITSLSLQSEQDPSSS